MTLRTISVLVASSTARLVRSPPNRTSKQRAAPSDASTAGWLSQQLRHINSALPQCTAFGVHPPTLPPRAGYPSNCGTSIPRCRRARRSAYTLAGTGMVLGTKWSTRCPAGASTQSSALTFAGLLRCRFRVRVWGFRV